jgi:CRP/FNR family transcriptional regulator, cyclic AMP receptor protein
MRQTTTLIRSPSLYLRLFEGLRVKPKEVAQNQRGSQVFVVTGTNWGGSLQPEEMREMAAICPPRPYRKGEIIFHQGDPAENLFIVLEGNVKLSMLGSTGRDRLVAICGPDDFFGESFLYGSSKQHAQAVCLAEKTVVCPVSRSQFLEVSQRIPSVALLFASVLVGRVRSLEQQLELMASPAQARLGRCLLLLAKRFGSEIKPGILNLNIGLKHEDLASLAATTRVSATQAISVWRAQGLIAGTRGEYQIRMEAFEAMIERLEQERL